LKGVAVSTWRYEIAGYEPERNCELESVFSQMNGYLGIRGYFEEGIPGFAGIPRDFTEEAGSYCNQYVAGFFDRSPVTGETMVNLPAMRLIRVCLDGEDLDLSTGVVRGFRRAIDMSCAVFERRFVWISPKGNETEICFTSFLSYPRRHVHATRIRIRPVNWSGEVILSDTFDCTGRTIRHHHHEMTGAGSISNGHYCEIRTLTSQLNAVLASAYGALKGLQVAQSERIGATARTHARASVETGSPVEIDRFLAVCTDFDIDAVGDGNLRAGSLCELDKAVKAGWDGLLSEQRDAWGDLWRDADITVSGDEDSEKKLRFSIFQMLQAYRPGDSRVSIGAKFLSGDHYAGHFFWDTDIFLFPFYLCTMPAAGRDLVDFRVRGLEDARAKAARMGFAGAFYPWEAGRPGDGENCPEFWQDEHSSEGVEILCGKIELHINSAVVYAMNLFTDVDIPDAATMRDLREVMCECARFWPSRGEWDGDRFVIRDVIGPDEYHEHVDNNAYTNRIAKWNMDLALAMDREAEDPFFTAEERDQLRRVSDAIELGYDDELGILPQDDTYLSKPELDRTGISCKKSLYSQVKIEDLGKHQITKQADVLALFQLFPTKYDMDLMRRCYEYYEPRTAHDSNLSAGTHAIVASLLGKDGEAWRFYQNVLNLDAGFGSFNIDQGLHAANAGNAWNATVMGFAGIRFDSDRLYCSPRLPAHWNELRFVIYYKRRRLRWRITAERISVDAGPGRDVELEIAGKTVKLGANAERTDLAACGEE